MWLMIDDLEHDKGVDILPDYFLRRVLVKVFTFNLLL